MSVYIEYEQEAIPDFNELIEKVIGQSLDYEECPYEAEVNVLLTDNPSIHEMNLLNRGIDRPTDVLSFPMNDFPEPADFDALESCVDAFHPETGELLLGDIVISYEKAVEQADAYQHSIEREIAFLTAHSMLHLMGYDHESEEERMDMEERQESILKILNINR